MRSVPGEAKNIAFRDFFDGRSSAVRILTCEVSDGGANPLDHPVYFLSLFIMFSEMPNNNVKLLAAEIAGLNAVVRDEVIYEVAAGERLISAATYNEQPYYPH